MEIRLITEIKEYPVDYDAKRNRVYKVLDTMKKGSIVKVMAENGKYMWVNETEFERITFTK